MRRRDSTDFSDPARRIIVALDVDSQERLLELVRALRGLVGMFKVGKELFTTLGPRAVELIHGEGGEVFLDLKFHDIPNTVEHAVGAAARLGVAMLTVHASGGPAMLQAAVAAAHAAVPAPLVVGVTVLTSLQEKDLQAVGVSGTVSGQVERLGKLATGCGLDGLVTSARELAGLRVAVGNKPVLVVPGIRPAGAAQDDQQRIATPAQAIAAGADFLVIGRPITRAADPAAAAEAIVDEMEGSA